MPLSAMFSHSNMRVSWADWKPTVRFLPRLAEVGRLCSVFAKTGWLCWWFFSCEGLSSASLWVLRFWPGTSSLLKGAMCSFRWPSLRLEKESTPNIKCSAATFSSLHALGDIIPVFPVFECFFFSFLLLIGNYFNREEPSVRVMEESTSTCLYGVLLLQRHQSRGVHGRWEGIC